MEKECSTEGNTRFFYFQEKTDNFETDCLAFADDQAIFVKDAMNAVKIINILKEVAEKTGIEISLKKTMIMANLGSAPKISGYKIWMN